MGKRQMIYNPSIHPQTFVFFFWLSDESWSVRNYSQPGHVLLHYARDFPGQTPETTLSSSVFSFPAHAHNTMDEEFWFEQTWRLNEQYLQRSRPEPVPPRPKLRLHRQESVEPNQQTG